MYAALSIISSCICIRVLWGWWKSTVYEHLGLQAHPITKIPMTRDNIDQLVVEMLTAMWWCQWPIIIVFGLRAEVEQVGWLESILAGAGVAAVLFVFSMVIFLHAITHPKMFYILVNYFTRHRARMKQ